MLRLLRDLPREWLRPGAHLGFTNVTTDLGAVTFGLDVSSDGRNATFIYDPVEGRKRPSHLSVDLVPLLRAEFRSADGSHITGHADFPGNRPWKLTLGRAAR
jgi:hypothetical protein